MTHLVVDIGGTYMRLALSDDGKTFTRDPQKIKTESFANIVEALMHFVQGEKRQPDSMTKISIAQSVRNDWQIGPDITNQYFRNSKFFLVNDFEANALGLIQPQTGEILYLGGGKKLPDLLFSRAVIGSGTGIGLAYINIHGNVQVTYGGHMLPALVTEDQRDIFKELQAMKMVKTVAIYEDALSGNGILNMYKILSGRGHLDCEYRDTNHLLSEGRNNPIVQQALKFYHEILGLFAHHVLAFGFSYGGLYLTGGVTDRIIGNNLFDTETFFANLYQQNIPVVLNDVKSTPVFWVKDEFISLRGLLHGVSK